MWNKRTGLGVLVFFVCVVGFSIAEAKPLVEPKASTQPIGSSFYRHLAFDYNIPIQKLVQYQERGFSRSEIITLLLLSQITGTELKIYGKQRLDNKVTLKELTEEAGLDFVTLYKVVQELKKNLSAKGDRHLPDPVYQKDLKKPPAKAEEK